MTMFVWKNEHFIPAILVPAFFIPHIRSPPCEMLAITKHHPTHRLAPPNSKASSSCVRVWSVRTHLFVYICCVPCVHIVVAVDVDSGSSNCTQDAHQLCRSSAPHRMCFLSDANERYRVFLFHQILSAVKVVLRTQLQLLAYVSFVAEVCGMFKCS